MIGWNRQTSKSPSLVVANHRSYYDLAQTTVDQSKVISAEQLAKRSKTQSNNLVSEQSSIVLSPVDNRSDSVVQVWRVNQFTFFNVPIRGGARKSWIAAYVTWLHWLILTIIMLLTLMTPAVGSDSSSNRRPRSSRSGDRGYGHDAPLLCYLCADHNNCASSLCSLNRSNLRDENTMRAYNPRYTQPYCYKEVRTDNGIKYTSKGCMMYNPGMATCFGVDMMDQASGTICLCNSKNFCNSAVNNRTLSNNFLYLLTTLLLLHLILI